MAEVLKNVIKQTYFLFEMQKLAKANETRAWNNIDLLEQT